MEGGGVYEKQKNPTSPPHTPTRASAVELTADEEAELFNKTMQLEEGGFGFVHELMDVGSDVTPMVRTGNGARSYSPETCN